MTAITVVEFPTQGQFIARAVSDFQAQLKTKRTGVVRATGPVVARWLERTKDGRRLEAIVDDECYDARRLSGFVLRSLCTRLAIPIDVFEIPIVGGGNPN